MQVRWFVLVTLACKDTAQGLSQRELLAAGAECEPPRVHHLSPSVATVPSPLPLGTSH